jgi:hypothetical protein
MLIESDSLKPPLLQLHCFLRLLPQSRIERPYKTGSLQGTEPFFFSKKLKHENMTNIFKDGFSSIREEKPKPDPY